MSTTDLSKTAPTLVADGRGILAADETVPTVTRRLAALSIESMPESRRACHDAGCLGLLQRVIMQDETIHQEIPPADLLIRQILGRYSSPSMGSESIVV